MNHMRGYVKSRYIFFKTILTQLYTAALWKRPQPCRCLDPRRHWLTPPPRPLMGKNLHIPALTCAVDSAQSERGRK